MAQHENCKKYVDCTWRNDVGYCLDYCNQFKHKDEVIVVRCKDCKHWHEETGWCYHHSHFVGANGEACHPWESNDWKMLNADDFCSYGERKDNEATD